jgi:hypothetical protein
LRVYKFIILFIITSTVCSAQYSDGLGVNLPKFYSTKLHFGFTLAVNHTDFRIHTVRNSALPDTMIDGAHYQIKSVYTKGDPGFAIGLVSDLRLHQYIRLRFTPNISFASRSLEYTMQTTNRDSSKVFVKSVESTFLIFPLELKLQSKRMGNFSAYIIGGGGYTLDLASNKHTANVGSSGNQLDEAVRIKRDDYFYSAGFGTDFYLQYFKFGLEVKLLIGTRNLLMKQNNIFSNSVDKINSHMVVFTLTFEG